MYSYYNIDVAITIGGKVRFNALHSARVVNSLERLSDTATIELPREFANALQNGKRVSIAKKRLLDYIAVGDTIKLEAGYDGKLNVEFEGYITDVGAEIPTVLKCEDEMYKLRTGAEINKTFASVSLKELLQFIAPNYEVSAQDIQLGKFMITQATPYKVLEVLKEQYGIRSYFNGKVLTAGLPIGLGQDVIHAFSFGRNIRQSSELIYKAKSDRKYWIKAISMQKGNAKKQEVYEFGEKGESTITLHAPLDLDKVALKKWAENYYKSVVFDGYEGNIDSWDLPLTKAGTVAKVMDRNYKDGHRNGNYLIESVTIDINGSVGIKRQNKITLKL